MDLRIATTILFFLSLYLHSSALDEPEIKHGKHPTKHSVALKRRKQTHKANVPELKPPEKETITIVRKSNTPKNAKNEQTDKNENFLEIRRALQGKKKKDDIEIVDSADEAEPPINLNENRRSEPSEEPEKLVKEIIFIRGVYDIRDLLKNLEVQEDEDQISRRTIPEEAKEKINELRVQLRRVNNGQPKVLEESSGEEIINNSEETRRTGGQSKEIDEEDEDSKPNTLKKYIIMKDEEDNPPSRRILLKKSNNDVDKQIINKDNILLSRKNMVEGNEEDEKEEKKEDDSSARKQTTKELSHIINRDKLLSSSNSFEEDNVIPTNGRNRKLNEQIYGQEPVSNSIENYIYVESPFRRQIGPKQIDDIARKYGIHTYPNEEVQGNVDINREYIIVRDKIAPNRRQMKKSESMETTNGLKRKSNKLC